MLAVLALLAIQVNPNYSKLIELIDSSTKEAAALQLKISDMESGKINQRLKEDSKVSKSNKRDAYQFKTEEIKRRLITVEKARLPELIKGTTGKELNLSNLSIGDVGRLPMSNRSNGDSIAYTYTVIKPGINMFLIDCVRTKTADTGVGLSSTSTDPVYYRIMEQPDDSLQIKKADDSQLGGNVVRLPRYYPDQKLFEVVDKKPTTIEGRTREIFELKPITLEEIRKAVK